MEMSIEDKYWKFVMDYYPENYGSKDHMIRNWEKGFAFDHFADFIGMTEEQLLEAI